MRVLAALFAVALLVVPFAACGGGGGGGCYGICSGCNFSSECCGSALCSNQTTSGFPQCINFDFQCKLGS